MPTNSATKRHDIDPLWHVQLAVAAAIALQFALPDVFLGISKFVLIGLELLLLVALLASTPRVPIFESILRRLNSVTLIALASLANIFSLQRLAEQLLAGGHITNGHQLILASVNIYLTNVIIFGLWYWELDGGGPGRRRQRANHERDFLFPQMSLPEAKRWAPTFTDYLYISVTNATAFSPTDTMPLTHRAKLIMALQAVASLITIALVAARAVNILS